MLGPQEDSALTGFVPSYTSFLLAEPRRRKKEQANTKTHTTHHDQHSAWYDVRLALPVRGARGGHRTHSEQQHK